jgi:hypothetical protein
MMTIEWTKTIPEIDIAPHRSTMTTAPEANTIAIAPLTDDTSMPSNTLDVSSLADTIPESANKYSENYIAGPDPDREHVHDSDVIHEVLMDIDSDSDESQVDTWSGGIPGGVPQTTTAAPEADDHKESLHFFPYNQKFIVRLIKNRNMHPDTSNTTMC